MVNGEEPMASQEQRHLSDLSMSKHAFILTGMTGSGKTTMLNALSKELNNDRWGAPKDNSVTLNKNTLRANETAVRSISSWLLQVKNINTKIEDMQPLEFVLHLAEYVLVVSEEHGLGCRSSSPSLLSPWPLAGNCLSGSTHHHTHTIN